MRRRPAVRLVVLLAWTVWLAALPFLAAPLLTSPAAAEPEPLRPASIYWIGNSFTLYNDGIPRMVQALAAADGGPDAAPLRMHTQAIGGAHLADHVKAPAPALAEGWDVVVIQGYSNEPIHAAKAAAFREALADLHARAEAVGARTALFMTWAYKDQPAMAVDLAAAYERAGRETGALVVPVGLAFAAAKAERPALALYVSYDNKHPSPAGTYLAACTFYAALFGRPPKDAAEGLGLFADSLTAEEARFLQATAWRTVAAYYGWPAAGYASGR